MGTFDSNKNIFVDQSDRPEVVVHHPQPDDCRDAFATGKIKSAHSPYIRVKLRLILQLATLSVSWRP